MRIPADMPRRRRTPRNRIWLIGGVVILFVLLSSLRSSAGFYTDYLWFKELHLTSVFRGVKVTQFLLSVIFTAIFFVLLWANLAIADRIAPRFRAVGPEDEIVQRFRDVVGPHMGKVRVVVSVLFALFAGVGTRGKWNDWLLFRNGATFGKVDPQFHKDLGFYIFKLPFLQFLVDWLFVAIVITTIITIVAHYLNGGIRLQSPAQRVSPQVKAHISLLLAALAVVKGVGYYLQRFELVLSRKHVVDGLTYTDAKAELPAKGLLMIIAGAAVILFVVNIWQKGWVLPAIAVGLWVFVWILVGAVYPAFIQKFRVEPAENSKERPYIDRNIKATRSAYNIDGVDVVNFAFQNALQKDDLQKNPGTIRNVRLWDPDPNISKTTYQKLQEIRSYYQFSDVDIDRYLLKDANGNPQLTQTLSSVRELNINDVPSSWVNRHLQFTHGFGAVLSPANAVQSDGTPNFVIRDVPPVSDPTVGAPPLGQPRVYYGEDAPGYAIVKSDQPELDYQKADGGNVTSNYSGTGGVPVGSFFRRLAFALHFGDQNFVISGQIKSSSRAIYVRDIGARVRKAAPFLRYDVDPYSVILGNRVLWIQDAYTVTNRYPYAQRANTERIANGSGLNTDFNYVRNSVKVVIDAYDGSMTFYVMDETDPIVKTYEKAFPSLFTSGKTMSPELKAHLRYPEDLFRVQTNMYGRYHITDPNGFYTQGDAWSISQDPGSGSPSQAVAQTQTTTANGVAGPSRQKRMDPTYLLMRLPDEQKESFLILQPFVPVSPSDKQQNLTAFMTAKSDPDDYGKLQAFVMPRGEQIDGPALVNSTIQATSEISSQISLLDQKGSKVQLGNVLVLPIEKSILYVRPLYVSSDQNPLPELRKVIVVNGDRAIMRDSLADALNALVPGANVQTLEQQPNTGTGNNTPPPTTTGPGVNATVQQLLDQAAADFNDAQTALKAGDLATYQQKILDAQKLVDEARQKGSSTTSTTQASA